MPLENNWQKTQFCVYFFTIFMLELKTEMFPKTARNLVWEQHIPAITCDKGIECYSTRIELFYFDDNFRRIAQWVLALTPFDQLCYI